MSAAPLFPSTGFPTMPADNSQSVSRIWLAGQAREGSRCKSGGRPWAGHVLAAEGEEKDRGLWARGLKNPRLAGAIGIEEGFYKKNIDSRGAETRKVFLKAFGAPRRSAVKKIKGIAFKAILPVFLFSRKVREEKNRVAEFDAGELRKAVDEIGLYTSFNDAIMLGGAEGRLGGGEKKLLKNQFIGSFRSFPFSRALESTAEKIQEKKISSTCRPRARRASVPAGQGVLEKMRGFPSPAAPADALACKGGVVK